MWELKRRHGLCMWLFQNTFKHGIMLVDKNSIRAISFYTSLNDVVRSLDFFPLINSICELQANAHANTNIQPEQPTIINLTTLFYTGDHPTTTSFSVVQQIM